MRSSAAAVAERRRKKRIERSPSLTHIYCRYTDGAPPGFWIIFSLCLFRWLAYRRREEKLERHGAREETTRRASAGRELSLSLSRARVPLPRTYVVPTRALVAVITYARSLNVFSRYTARGLYERLLQKTSRRRVLP